MGIPSVACSSRNSPISEIASRLTAASASFE
jgi:hypothetical protein